MRTGRLVCLAACAALAGAVQAGTGVSESQLRYRLERAACMNGTSVQDRATCLKEAGAALRESRRSGLGNVSEAGMEGNRLARCEMLRAPDREDCVLRMREGSVSGTAQQGGILREHRQAVPTR